MTDNGFFTGEEAFAFYKMPKWLYQDKRFDKVSISAKLLYAILLDLTNLSRENGLWDENGRIFVFYPVKKICQTMHCGSQKADKILDDLEKVGLLERQKQGMGKANKLFIKHLVEKSSEKVWYKSKSLKRKNHY